MIIYILNAILLLIIVVLPLFRFILEVVRTLRFNAVAKKYSLKNFESKLIADDFPTKKRIVRICSGNINGHNIVIKDVAEQKGTQGFLNMLKSIFTGFIKNYTLLSKDGVEEVSTNQYSRISEIKGWLGSI